MNLDGSVGRMIKKKKASERRSNKRNWCLLVLANKLENPNFEKWTVMLIIYHKKKQEIVNVSIGRTQRTPDDHCTFLYTLGIVDSFASESYVEDLLNYTTKLKKGQPTFHRKKWKVWVYFFYLFYFIFLGFLFC